MSENTWRHKLKQEVVSAAITVVVTAAILGPIGYMTLQRARQDALRATCESSMTKMASAMSAYLDDWHGRFPPPERWNEVVVSRYCRTPDWCAACGGPSYAMNARLKGLSIKDVKDPANTVLLFESIEGKDLSGGPELFPNPPRHLGGHAVAFVDGRVLRVRGKDAGKLNWDPMLSKSPSN